MLYYLVVDGVETQVTINEESVRFESNDNVDGKYMFIICSSFGSSQDLKNKLIIDFQSFSMQSRFQKITYQSFLWKIKGNRRVKNVFLFRYLIERVEIDL